METDGPYGAPGIRGADLGVDLGRGGTRALTDRRNDLAELLLAEILRDTHRYTPGIDQRHPTLVPRSSRSWRRLIAQGRERCRDLVERAAATAGFSRRHFDPDAAAARLDRLLELSEGLAATYAQLADDHSRRTMIDVLKLRVLGPYHAPLPMTPQRFRMQQARVERDMRTRNATFEVSDPWFSPLSLYRVPVDNGETITLHDHSVDIVSVFLLGQYGYAHGPSRIEVEPGDVVLDAGGCWGDTPLYFAARAGASGKVYTFEFDPESLEILRVNLSLNPELAPRIQVVEQALWDRAGELLEFLQAGRCTSVLVDNPSEQNLRVPAVTLDDFVERAGIDRLDFVKMDVEGAELNALRGGLESIKRFAPKLAIAAYHNDDDLVRIPEVISSLQLGYRFYLDTFSSVEEETVLFAGRSGGH